MKTKFMKNRKPKESTKPLEFGSGLWVSLMLSMKEFELAHKKYSRRVDGNARLAHHN